MLPHLSGFFLFTDFPIVGTQGSIKQLRWVFYRSLGENQVLSLYLILTISKTIMPKKTRSVYVLSSHWTNMNREPSFGVMPMYYATTSLKKMHDYLLTLDEYRPYGLKGYSKFFKDFHASDYYCWIHRQKLISIMKLDLNAPPPYDHQFR